MAQSHWETVYGEHPLKDFDPSEQKNALERPSVMQTFRERVNKFWDVYQSLSQRENEVPEKMRSEYSGLMDRGTSIRQTLETLTSTYDAVSEWVSDVLGYNGSDVGLDGVMWRDVAQGNLGAVQFVPLAVITGASAFIVKWLKDAYTMERKLNEYKRLQDQGYDADRASEIVDRTVTGPGLLNLGMNLKPLAIIGGIGFGLWFANRKGWI